MATLKVEIVTPESPLWVGDATSFTARSSEGSFTILPQHTSTVGDLISGVVRVQTNEGELAFAVHGGFFQVGPDDIEGVTLTTVLAGVAEAVSDIDTARAERAKEAAETALAAFTRTDQLDDAATLVARAALDRAELRLACAAR